jgi:mono/diheme cytochrome c family protein
MPKAHCRTLLLVAVVTAGTAAAGEAPAPAALPLSRGRLFEEQGGAALFSSVCAGCHQPDASGASGAADYPALTKNSNVASADYMERLLLNGQRGMPPVGQMMSDQQIADVINYVRTHFGNAYDDVVSAADVGAARRQTGPDP